MARDYAARVELDERDTSDPRMEELCDLLAAHHAAVGIGPTGLLTVNLTVAAQSLRQAADLAVLVVCDAAGRAGGGRAGGDEPIGVEVLQYGEFNRRLDEVQVPPLVSVTEAAKMLGLTRQGVLKIGGSGGLGATRVGNAYAFPRGLVQREARRRQGVAPEATPAP